ncbi:MAG TPA: metal-sensitive transcriptional regulator [Anaerolineaceae bacterium]|nr:metal-sensitive transcriptional regulator [Anaerolineaceae bacterium]
MSSSYRKIENRIHRLEGQLRGINKMIEEGRDCREVVQQFTAARSALQSTMKEYLAEMVSDCLVDDNVELEVRRKLADDLLAVIQSV